MLPARIAELLEPYLGEANGQRLTTNDLDRISTYVDLLLRWNARINLTAIRNQEEVVTRHFGESFFAASHLFPLCSSVPPVVKASDVANDQRPATNARLTVADLGSGAGFPGLPLKLWAPAISLTLIESNHKKAAFLREVVRALTLTDVNIKNTRAEQVTSCFDLVTLRAVERFANVLPVATSLVAPGGRLALLIGAAQAPEALAAFPTFAWQAPIPIPASRSRVLLVATTNR